MFVYGDRVSIFVGFVRGQKKPSIVHKNESESNAIIRTSTTTVHSRTNSVLQLTLYDHTATKRG
jgi:hypothetical protein